MVGVSLTATIPSNGGGFSDTATTDPQGVANFTIVIPLPNTYSPYATVRFTDQNTYGSDTCTITFRGPS